jgi:1,4-dihydroxy-6-naphthoate synthase
VMRRTLGTNLCSTVDSIIKESLAYSWQRYPMLSPFITANAQEMEEEVMRKHIQLYVNDYTTDLGEKGRNAIAILFEKARQAGLLKEAMPASIFY